MIRHPAKFTDSILLAIQPYISHVDLVLDPFAGTGKLRNIAPLAFLNELEPEWAIQGKSSESRVTIGNALWLPYAARTFDVICTSPCYGNRMADHHDAKDKSRRNTYTHALGRKLNPENAGQLQWGDEYKRVHRLAWQESDRVLKPGGLFILNVSDHIRKGKPIYVSEWHLSYFVMSLGYTLVEHIAVITPRQRYGANSKLRSQFENVLVLEKSE